MKSRNIRKYLTFSTFTLVLLLSLVNCKKKDQAITCYLSCDAKKASVGMTIIYTATQTGDGTMATLSYVTSTGTVTIANPKLPWADTVFVPANTSVTLSATGTTTNGSLQVTYQGGEGGIIIVGSNSCSQQTE